MVQTRRCRICRKEGESLSETLPICLDCLRSGEKVTKPFVEEAHHRSRNPFRLINAPPDDASGIPAVRCKEIAEEEGLRRVRIGNVHLL